MLPLKMLIWCRSECWSTQFVIFKQLIYYFKETIGFDVRASFASRPESRLMRWHYKLGDITKEFWLKVIHFHGTFHRLKKTNCTLRLVFREREEFPAFNQTASVNQLHFKELKKRHSLLSYTWKFLFYTR